MPLHVGYSAISQPQTDGYREKYLTHMNKMNNDTNYKNLHFITNQRDIKIQGHHLKDGYDG
jgi:hypothetical protein